MMKLKTIFISFIIGFFLSFYLIPTAILAHRETGHLQSFAGMSSYDYSQKLDTGLEWHSFETPHFIIHYHKGLEDLSTLAVLYAEESHELLAPLMKWVPKEKTHLILSDTLDRQDGKASNLPFPNLRIFPYSPSISGVIAEYERGDWLRALILHEYVHILHLDTVRGYSKFIRKWFGRPGFAPAPRPAGGFPLLNSPNNYAPFWLWEGMAVYYETELTHSGRGRSARSEMMFRMATLEDDFIHLDQLDFYRPGTPGEHESRYVYSAYFVNYLVNTTTPDWISDTSHKMAGWLPYVGIHAVEGKDGSYLTTAYDQFIEHLKSEQKKRINILKTQSFTPYTPLNPQGYRQRTMALSNDESRLAFMEHDADVGKQLIIWNKFSQKRERVLSEDAYSIDWFPEGRFLFFTALNDHDGYGYQDLFVYDMQLRKTYTLTEDARLGDVAISPDGEMLVGVESEKGNQNLVLYKLTRDFSRKKPPFKVERDRLLTDLKYHRVAHPQWDAKGKHIVYSLTDRTGTTSLPVISVESGKDVFRIQEGHLLSFPAWEPEKDAILFCSDHTGVSNIYRYDIDNKTILPVTHVMGGAFQPIPAKKSNRLFFQNYTGSTMALVHTPWKPGNQRNQPLPEITPTWQFNPELKILRDTSKLPDVQPTNKDSYSPWKSMKPNFWFFYAEDAPKGWAPGIITAGQDALEEHFYYAAITYQDQPFYQLGYIYDHFYPTFSLTSVSIPQRFPRGLQIPQVWETFNQNTLQISFKVGDDWTFGLGAIHQVETPIEDDDILQKVNDKRPALREGEDEEDRPKEFTSLEEYFKTRTFIGTREGYSLSIGYSDVGHYPLSFNDEYGRIFSLTYTAFPADRGDDPDIYIITGDDFDSTIEDLKRDDPYYITDNLTDGRIEKTQVALRAKEQRLSNDYSTLLLDYIEYVELSWSHQLIKLETRLGTSTNSNSLQGAFMTRYSIPVRGYKDDLETAEQFAMQTVEWQLPLATIFRGIGLLPVYFKHLTTALFYDYAVLAGTVAYADVYMGNEIFYIQDSYDEALTRRGTGLELKVKTQLGYRFPINLVLRVTQAIDINEIPGIDGKDGILAEVDYEFSF